MERKARACAMVKLDQSAVSRPVKVDAEHILAATRFAKGGDTRPRDSYE